MACKLEAEPGGSFCAFHQTEMHKRRAEERLTLARSSASANEAESAALSACSWMAQHKLVFHPRPPALDATIRSFISATADAHKREAALRVAKASASSKVVTFEERARLVEQAAAAAKPKVAAPSPSSRPGARPAAVGRPPAEVGRVAKAVIAGAGSWAKAVSEVARDALKGVTMRNGESVASRAARMHDEVVSVGQGLSDLVEALEQSNPRPRQTTTGKAAKVTKGAKAKPNAGRARKTTRSR
jgi:hypothetical protein